MLNVKKIKFIGFVLILLLTVFSCNNRPIAGPLDVKYDHINCTLHWSEVEGASYYLLDLNGEKLESDNNYYSLFNYSNGIYRVKIKAIFKKKESTYSNTLTFEISDNVEVLVYSDGEYLYWEEIENGIYVIDYEDDSSVKSIILTENKFKIPETLKTKSSIMSLSMYFDDYLITTKDIILDYNLRRYYNEPYEIIINGAETIFINGEEIKAGYYIYSDKVILSSKFIEQFKEPFYLYINGDENLLAKVEIGINLFDLKSFYIQPFVGDDVKYDFDFRGFEIEEINGLIYNKDYKIEGNMLIIKQSFIENYINKNPLDERIKLNLVLKKGDFIKDWYLEIDLVM